MSSEQSNPASFICSMKDVHLSKDCNTFLTSMAFFLCHTIFFYFKRKFIVLLPIRAPTQNGLKSASSLVQKKYTLSAPPGRKSFFRFSTRFSYSAKIYVPPFCFIISFAKLKLICPAASIFSATMSISAPVAPAEMAVDFA